MLCLLLCWTVFQGVQATLHARNVPLSAECFGACGLDAVMGAEVIAED